MKSLISLIFHFIISSLITYGEGGVTLNYETVIQTAFDLYGTDGVIMAVSRNHLSLANITAAFQVMKDMSRRGVLSVVLDFSHVRDTMEFYKGRIGQPLIVIFIDDISDLHKVQNVTMNTDMSYPVWLLLFTDHNNGDSCELCHNLIGNPFNLEFNSEMLVSCCNSVLIDELWSKTRDHTWKRIRGQWLEENKTIDWYRNESFYNRQYSKGREKFRIVIIEHSRYIWEKSDHLDGFLSDIVNELCQILDFTQLEVIEESSYGTLDAETSQWTGAIGAVARGEVHLGAAEFTMTSKRIDVVEFTLPFALGKNRLWFKKPSGSAVHWDAYLKAFHPEIWMAIIALLTITPLLLTIIRYKRGDNFFHMICEHYLNVWGIFCQQALSEYPHETLLRTVYISIFISGTVLYAAYSASLISYLATYTSYAPFNSLEEFTNDGTYKLIVLRDSADYDLFQESNDTVLMNMMEMMKPQSLLPRSVEQGFQQVCNEKVAFYTNDALKHSLNIYLPCEVSYVETTRIDDLAMITPRNSKYRKLIDYHMQRFRDNGILNRLRIKYFMKSNPVQSTYEAVEFQSIVPILAIMATGFAISIIIFSIELIYHHYNRHVNAKPRRLPFMMNRKQKNRRLRMRNSSRELEK